MGDVERISRTVSPRRVMPSAKRLSKTTRLLGLIIAFLSGVNLSIACIMFWQGMGDAWISLLAATLGMACLIITHEVVE